MRSNTLEPTIFWCMAAFAVATGCQLGGKPSAVVPCDTTGLAVADVTLIHSEVGDTGVSSITAITEPTQISSEDEYRSAWSGFDFTGEPPTVDFETRSVVAYSVVESTCKNYTILHGFYEGPTGSTVMRNEHFDLCATCDILVPFVNYLWEAPIAALEVCEFETEETGCDPSR